MAQSGSTAGAPPLLARAHHGSVSKEQRAEIEDDLKSGRLRCVVATSSLELGIDMGAVDLVIQVESPPSVASGLQRVGRAGHQVGEISKGVLFPKHRADLLHTTVATERMRLGLIEAIAVPQNPLDILAQQTVAAVALDPLDVEEWFETVRRSAPFATLPRSAYEATLDLLSGRYPSDEFAELRPRIVWDRVAGTITGRPGRATPGGDERRHDPGSRPVRRLHRRHRGRPASGRRARRGDGLRVAGRRRLRARRDQLADRGDHLRPRAGEPRVRAAGSGAVLEGRRARPSGRARQGDRRVHAGARRGRSPTATRRSSNVSRTPASTPGPSRT